ncbi:MAG TPA: lasso peptide biosynthesis B2 protein [Stellaceae bacterium]|nr:lasso peptide biosynthesis B2 protein [Stellaceae bacterium]
MTAYYPAAELRYRVVDDLAVILDLRTGEYVILDRTATTMWRVLLDTEPERRLPTLQHHFDAPAERLAADLEGFAASCVERGFLRRERPPPPPPPAELEVAARGSLLLRAWWTLFVTTRGLARQQFPQIYRRCSQLPKPTTSGSRSDDLLRRALAAFSGAENFFIIAAAPRDCLPRSLALYRFLMTSGVPVEHCIGVVRYPFEAHAWVEYRGEVLLDAPDYVRSYAELARM